MFGVNPLDFQSKFNAKCLSDYDEIHDISPQATSASVSANIDLVDYFASTGLKSVVFFVSYVPMEDVTSVTLNFSVGYHEGSISQGDKFLITYYDGTDEKSIVISGVNGSGDTRDSIQLSFNAHCCICKFVVNHVNN